MSILKFKDSQGNWIGVPTVKGDTGNGISSAVLNGDYTLTLTFTDGTTYTTPSIRGEKGEQGDPATSMDIHICSSSEYDSETRVPIITNPNDKTFYLVPTEDGTSPDLFTEWVYVNNAWEMFGSASVDLTDYVKNTDYATDTVGGVIKVNTSKGLAISSNGTLETSDANVAALKNGTDRNSIVSARRLAPATFYGLAKAAGNDEKDSELPVGQYTDEAKTSIQSMLGVPSEDDVVTDVQTNGTSITTDGVANIPIASANVAGVVKVGGAGNINGIMIDSGGNLKTTAAVLNNVKTGTATNLPIVPSHQHESAFYGLAKASGTDEKDSTLPVGQYTDNAKDSIQNMLGITPLIASHETDPFESNHVVGELFIIGGKLYRAKIALTAGEYVNEGTNVEVVNTSDVYVKNTDWAGESDGGIVKINGSYGLSMLSNKVAGVLKAYDSDIKNGTAQYRPIVPSNQHSSVFYGLAKASGDTTQSQSNNAVGTYTDEAKASIQTMLGVPSSDDVVSDVQIDGSSIVVDGVANVPIGGTSNLGVFKVNGNYGTGSNNGTITISAATSVGIKNGANGWTPLIPARQHESTFYGLTKAAGVDMSSSSNAVGTYTDEAKTAIKQMLGVKDNYDSFIIDVDGTDPVITGQPSYRYNCGELYSLTVTPPSSGTIDFRFTSGSTPTVLTLPQTVKMPEWWVEVEANTIYEMCITDGVYCGVMSWAM